MAEEYSIMYVSIFIYHIFFIHCLGWTLGLTSIILAIVSSATMNLMVHQSFQISAFIFFPDIYLEGELLGHMEVLYLIFSEPPYFHITCIILHSHQLYSRDPIFPHPCQHLFFSFLFFDSSYLNGCEVAFYYGFNAHFPYN